jgi:hypothetical protein
VDIISAPWPRLKVASPQEARPKRSKGNAALPDVDQIRRHFIGLAGLDFPNS